MSVTKKDDSIIAVLNTHIEVEEAVRELQEEGFDTKKLSILGRDYHAEEQMVGYYNTRDRVRFWGAFVFKEFEGLVNNLPIDISGRTYIGRHIPCSEAIEISVQDIYIWSQVVKRIPKCKTEHLGCPKDGPLL